MKNYFGKISSALHIFSSLIGALRKSDNKAERIKTLLLLTKHLFPSKEYEQLIFKFKLSLNNPSNKKDSFEALLETGKHLLPEYRFKWPEMDWWKHTEFNEYLEKFNEIDFPNTDRRWMLFQLLRLTDNVSGDTAECGVYKGASSFLICKNNQKNINIKKTHYIFDSFEGLSEPDKEDGNHWTKGDLKTNLANVKETLSEFKNTSYHQGWIPKRFSDVKDKMFSFVHIDVDLSEPSKESMLFFYSRTEPGGIILCDDYGFSTCPGVTSSLDVFLKDKPEKMISLSGGGGFFIKGKITGGLGNAKQNA